MLVELGMLANIHIFQSSNIQQNNFENFLPKLENVKLVSTLDETNVTSRKICHNEARQETINGLTLKVICIDIKARYFLVDIELINDTNDSLNLPLFQNFYVNDNRGNQFEADSRKSRYPGSGSMGPGTSFKASIWFDGKLVDAAKKLNSAGFNTVFGSFKVDSIYVRDISIPLRSR